MNLLELFSGTHSVGKVATTKGYNVISVDIDDYKGKYPPTHKVDIMNFDYEQYPIDHFDVIWASPPCCFYSSLQNTWLGRHKRINGELTIFTREMLDNNMLISDEWVKRTLEIINYFNPRLWFIENPRTGKLKNRPFMSTIPYYDIDYCKYSTWGYKKATRIWTNKEFFDAKTCNKDCNNMIGNKHACDVSKDKHKLDRYRIPRQLIEDLLD